MTVPLSILGQEIFCLVGLMIIKVCPIYLCFAVILIIVIKSTFIVFKVVYYIVIYINTVTLINKFTTIITMKH